MRADKDLEVQARESQRHQCKSCGAVSSQYEFLLAFAGRVRAEALARGEEELQALSGAYYRQTVRALEAESAAKKARAEYEEYHGHEKCVSKVEADGRIAKEQEFWRSEVKKARAEALREAAKRVWDAQEWVLSVGQICRGIARDLRDLAAEAER